jgi:hypothetical protein
LSPEKIALGIHSKQRYQQKPLRLGVLGEGHGIFEHETGNFSRGYGAHGRVLACRERALFIDPQLLVCDTVEIDEVCHPPMMANLRVARLSRRIGDWPGL